jgi:hypothetical protein
MCKFNFYTHSPHAAQCWFFEGTIMWLFEQPVGTPTCHHISFPCSVRTGQRKESYNAGAPPPKAIITLFLYTRHYATASNGKCYDSTTISWRMKLLFHKWLTFLTLWFLSNQTISDVCPKWSHFSSPTTWYIKSHIRLTETFWPILLFTRRYQTDSC